MFHNEECLPRLEVGSLCVSWVDTGFLLGLATRKLKLYVRLTSCDHVRRSSLAPDCRDCAVLHVSLYVVVGSGKCLNSARGGG